MRVGYSAPYGFSAGVSHPSAVDLKGGWRVGLSDGAEYSIELYSDVDADAVVLIDGRAVGRYRIHASCTLEITRPTTVDRRFTFVSGGHSGDITVTFYPETVTPESPPECDKVVVASDGEEKGTQKTTRYALLKAIDIDHITEFRFRLMLIPGVSK